jgi:hypothetical protein
MYERGETVIVKKDADKIYCERISFVYEMYDWRGKTLTIKSKYSLLDNCYRVYENEFVWHSDWFEDDKDINLSEEEFDAMFKRGKSCSK